MNAITWIAEQRIKEGLEQGFFDVPCYRGVRLVVEEGGGEFWLAHKVLKNGGFLPIEVELRKTIAALRERLQKVHSADEWKALEKEMNEHLLRLNLSR